MSRHIRNVMDDQTRNSPDNRIRKTQPPRLSLPAPVPTAGTKAYQNERRYCLELDDRKKANFELYQSSKHSNKIVKHLPIKLDIENVSRCNFRCVMCAVTDWDKSQRADDMSLDDFKRLVDENYGLVEIKLQGLGEPTMQGDDYFEMIKYARERHIWVRTVTNGSLLHLNDNIKKIVEAGSNEIQISIDGATSEVFEAVRRGSNFERVIDNCRELNQYCQDAGVEITKMAAVVQRLNRHQLPDLIKLAADLGFRNLVFGYNLIGWGDPALLIRNQLLTPPNLVSDIITDQLVLKGREFDVQIGFWISNHKYSTLSRETICPWPFERALISSDNRIVPCCMITNPDFFEFGRDSTDSLAEIWRGEEYQEFRRQHTEGDIPVICRNCYDGT